MKTCEERPDLQDFFVVRFDVAASLLAVVDFEPVDFEAVVFLTPVEREPADFVPFDFAFDVVDFDDVLGDLAAVVFLAALPVPLDFALPLGFELLLDRRDVVFLSPLGSAPPTAFTAPLAASPTVPATFPTVFPTFLTTLPGSGIGCPPFIRPLTERSTARKMQPACRDRTACVMRRRVHDDTEASRRAGRRIGRR